MPGTSKKFACLAAAIFLCLGIGAISPPALAADQNGPTFKEVPYGAHERDLLNFWQAESDSPTPLVVHIHGGGFRQGDKKSSADSVVRKCLENGISVASISYPFYEDVPLIEIIRDHIARAVQFLRWKAGEWNIDKTRVAVYGTSAGAGSSLWLAFHDDIADPDNADLVLRESTRVLAAGALHTQATYDLALWPKALGMKRYEIEGIYPGLTQRGLEMYHLEKEEDLQTEEMIAVRKDLDMAGMIGPDDPPVYLLSTSPDGGKLDILHHPRHGKTIKRICDKKGVEAILILNETPEDEQPDLADFLIGRLQ